MQKLIFFLFLGMVSLGIQAQNFNIKGQLTDEKGEGLPSATVLLLNANDSVMVNYALSNTQGHFEIKNVSPRNYLIRFSYMGFATITLPFENPEGILLDFGVIKLPEDRKSVV